MKNIYKVFIFSFLIFSIFFIGTGCKKIVEHKIVGTWSLVHVDNLHNTNNDEWIFTDNKEVFFNTPSNYPYLDTGQYKISTSSGKKYVEIFQCRSDNDNNKYRIMKLNSRIMKLIIESNHGLTFFEFTKTK